MLRDSDLPSSSSRALREVEALKECERIQVAVHKKVLKLEAARFQEALDKQAAVYAEELQLQKFRFEREMRARVAALGRDVQAEVKKRRFAEFNLKREREGNVYHYEQYQYYKQEYYAEVDANEDLRHELSHARAPAYERRMPAAGGPVRRAGHARDAAHPYRAAAPRYVGCRFA